MPKSKNKKYLKIGKQVIGNGRPAFIIAEAGVNHNGSLKLAKQLVAAAQAAGADAVKFQTFVADQVMVDSAPKAKYQLKLTNKGETQLEMAKGFELTFDDFVQLRDYAKEKGIMFISTPFDLPSARFLINLKLPAIKIASGEITNYPLLDLLASARRPLILSTGMSTMSEIKKALTHLKSCPVILLHCTSNYPTLYKNVNLKVIKSLAHSFDNMIGFSDHTPGIEAAIAAVAMGARVIEKHFTLDKNLPGPDHQASLDPAQLTAMVAAIKNIEAAMGSAVKAPTKSELEVKKIARKSLVAQLDIPKGAVFTTQMISIKRPGTGLGPAYYEKFIGKIAAKNICKNSLLKWEHVL